MTSLHETLLQIERALAGGTALTPDSALLTYRWSSRRGDETYDALMSGVYLKQPDGEWKLTLHQQTPASP